MPSPSSRRSAVSIACLAALLMVSTGCQKLKKQVDDDSDIRAQVVKSSRDACVSKANEISKDKTPEMNTRINNYCECIATKGMGKFSNSELAQIGLQGGHMNADQDKRLQQAVDMCQSNLEK